MGSKSGSEQAAMTSPVAGSVTMTLPETALASATAAVSCSSATCCTLMSSEVTMSVPSLASWIWDAPPATGVPSRPRSMTISPSVPESSLSY